MSLVFPTAQEMKLIEQTLIPRITEGRLGLQLMPVVNSDYHILSWEQKDNYTGLQAVRGLNGQPGRVTRIGGRRYTMPPGVYGEFTSVDEAEVTARRAWGSINTVVDISDLIAECQEHLLIRRYDRIEKIIWDLLVAGTFSVSNEFGVIHTDTFDIQTYDATTWSTVATSTPLVDFRAIQLLGRGTSNKFDAAAGAKAYMSRATFNYLVANTNANDIAGRRVTGLLSPLTLSEINVILLGEGLPTIEIYDEGYLDSNGTFQLFIPINKVVVVGGRPGGAKLGEYRMTRNANNPGQAPGAYQKVAYEENEVPFKVDVHDGHNGGPVLYFPGGIVVMDVS